MEKGYTQEQIRAQLIIRGHGSDFKNCMTIRIIVSSMMVFVRIGPSSIAFHFTFYSYILSRVLPARRLGLTIDCLFLVLATLVCGCAALKQNWTPKTELAQQYLQAG